MLDRDLAALYGVETRVLNQAVRRNRERFPADFMFSLGREEIMRISQIVISYEIKFSKHVFAFTEQGVAMLSSVISEERQEIIRRLETGEALRLDAPAGGGYAADEIGGIGQPAGAKSDDPERGRPEDKKADR